MSELSFYELIDEVDGLSQEVATDFAVRDLSSADWCVRKAASAERRMQQRKDFVTAYRAKLDDWLAKANTADLRTTERMAELLQPWAEKELDGQQRQSVSLPTGTVGFRRSPDSIEIVDAIRAIEILKLAGYAEFVRVKEEIDKRALMAHVKAGGALPEGCSMIPGIRRFFVKVGSDE